MSTKLAPADGPNSMHNIKYSAGIFADMTVDGPEIGTLVMICDRAKNLPNRKTMGKQNPYCAARFGKEAKKTEVDKRGGQTPKWDQELRFTVHDSPDYNQMKLSVFSEDKRTELIGEAWVSLADTIIPGGGKSDIWQGLNCKGKYAGEIRLEFTYYDSRPKPERPRGDSVAGDETMSAHGRSKVKRRPLPGMSSKTPDMIIGPPGAAVIPVPGRARHGPREIGTPSRANSMPPESLVDGSAPFSTPPAPQFQTPPNMYNDQPMQYDDPQAYDDGLHSQPDFLPQLPPSNRQRASVSHHSRQPSSQVGSPAYHQRAQSHAELIHSHSAPVIPTVEPDLHPGFGLHTDGLEPLPDLEYQHQQLRQRRQDVPPGWENPYDDGMAAGRQPYVEDEDAGPPPPPMHSHSAPVVPHFAQAESSATSRYGGTPPSVRQSYISNASPLQSIERGYGSSPRQTPDRGHGARGRSVDEYTPSPPAMRAYDSTPPAMVPGMTPSPVARSPAARALPHRHSVADPYSTNTPPRPHPLSQEVPRARSPLPPMDYGGGSQYEPQGEYRSRDAVPLIKPRAISPQPSHTGTEQARPKSSYNLRHPIRAFESSDQSPLSTGRPIPNRSTPTRKSVSPHPSPPNSASAGPGGVPFGPDSFDIHNPSAGSRAAPLGSHAASPNAPYHIRATQDGTQTRDEQRGPIVGWDGREIDPSDHLPVDSWAPEPKKKTPTKEYGLGRDRDFGPRNLSAANSPASGQRLSKDTVVNFRMKSHSNSQPSTPPSAQQTTPSSRNRLTKNNRTSPTRSPMSELSVRDHTNYNPVPDPYAQQHSYSSNFHNDGSPYDQNQQYGYPAPPPKLPLEYTRPGSSYGGGGFGEDALSREIAQIDIGAPTGSTRRMGGAAQAQAQYQRQELPSGWGGVRSQRERGGFY